MKWFKIGRTVKGTGESTITYAADSARYIIESRKRAIPHANRSGSWMHTSYFLISEDGTEKEYYSLRDAKNAAEKLAMEEAKC